MLKYHQDCEDIKIRFDDDQSRARETKKISDKRIHLILYLFDGHRIKDQDFHSVKEFQEHTNVIPLLAKGDSFTREEMKMAKE